MTAFGDSDDPAAMFTGKPQVEELGHVFLFRNYRAELGKWQTADPLGYPDGWNQLAYCNNGVVGAIDYNGTFTFGIAFTFSATVIGGPTISAAIGYNTSTGSIYINDSFGGGSGYDVSFSVQGFYSSAEPTSGTTTYYDSSASIFCATGSVSVDTSTYNESYAAGVTFGTTLIPATPVGGHIGVGANITTELFNLSDFLYDIFYKVDENKLDFSSIVNAAFTSSIGEGVVIE